MKLFCVFIVFSILCAISLIGVQAPDPDQKPRGQSKKVSFAEEPTVHLHESLDQETNDTLSNNTETGSNKRSANEYKESPSSKRPKINTK